MKIRDSLIVMLFVSMSFADIEQFVMNNTTQIIAFGTCYNVTDNISWQVFCAPAYPKLDVNTTLMFEDTFSNDLLNITIRAPAYPKLNVNTTLGYSDVFYNANANITIRAPSYPNIQMNCTQLFTKYNVNRSLSYDEQYTNPDANISISCPSFPRLNSTINLSFGQQYAPSDARYGLSVTCQWINLAEYESYKTNYATLKTECDAAKIDRDNARNDLASTLNKLTNMTEDLSACKAALVKPFLQNSNKTCNLTTIILNDVNVSYCPEDVTSLCTPDEKLTGQLTACINRLATEATKKTEDLTQQLAVCNIEKARCQSGEQQNIENANRWTMIIVGFAACIGGGWLITEYLKHKRAVEE